MSIRRFTLVEMMIVVAIILVLAAIAIPLLNDYQLKSKRSELLVVSDGFVAAMAGTYIDLGYDPFPAAGAIDGCMFVPRAFGSIDKKLVNWPAVSDCDVWGYRPDGAVRCTYMAGQVAQYRGYCDVDDDNNPSVIQYLWDDTQSVYVASGGACGPILNTACNIY